MSAQRHQTRNQSRAHARAYHARRGSILILVVSVLVLLAITATVYVGVGRQERLSASAEELKSHREAVSSKVFDYIGQVLALDLFGNDASATLPFTDDIEPLGYGRVFNDYPLVAPERWDFPYTRPGNFDVFNVLADPWLASTEPIDSDNDGDWDIWPHISNIHPQGRFVDLGKFFGQNRGLDGGGFYNNLFIGGNNAFPYQMDTFTGGGGQFNYREQMSRQVTGEADDSVVTWADRRYGADSDADGRIDSRWTELSDVYGLPKEMRYFVGVRIVDSSSMLNMNANFESGIKSPGDASDSVGWGWAPTDVDLYTFLYDAMGQWGQWQNLPTDQQFIQGGRLYGLPVAGFLQHIIDTGIQARYIGGIPYSATNRSTRQARRDMWNEASRQAYRSTDGLLLYGPADEIELRSNMFRTNERGTSRLEMNFDGWNFDPGTANTWHSPFRNRSFIGERLDYSQGTPTIRALQLDSRHLLSTYTGSRPVRPWNSGWRDADAPAQAPNPNTLIAQADSDPAVFQDLVGAFMWSLAPFAIDRGADDGSDSGQSVYGTSVVWQPPSLNLQVHYGDGDAGYAYLKSAQMAMNAVDAMDDDNEPKGRTLVFDRVYTGPSREDVEIIGEFEFGRIPATLPGPNGDQRGTNFTIFGLEPQPFIREVTAVNVYGNIDDNLRWNYEPPPEGDPAEWVTGILAVELGNPFAVDIDLEDYRLQFGGNPMWPMIGAGILGPGETKVIYVVRGDDTDPEGVPAWESIVDGRGGPNSAGIVSLGNVTLEFEGVGGQYDEVLLWKNSFDYGSLQSFVPMLVDRMRPASSSDDFPNIIPITGEDIPVNTLEIEYTVRVGSMRRYSGDAGGQMSFPGYVLQSPESIAADGRSSGQAEDTNMGQAIPTGLVDTALMAATDYMNDQDDNKGYGVPLDFAPFQLITGNLEDNAQNQDQEFRSGVDLLLLSSVGHLHLEQIAPGATPQFNLPEYYATVSEQLGDELLRNRLVNEVPGITATVLDIIRPAGGSVHPPDFRLDVNGQPNRFIGKLDYTRYIPVSGQVALPYEAIPMACRILDAFETMSVDARVPLVQGRININTAPQRVLEALPFLNPRFQVGPIPSRDQANGLFMARALSAYRDRDIVNTQSPTPIDWSADLRYEVSNLKISNNSGLRDDASSSGLQPGDRHPGFVSLGELLLATRWTPTSAGSYLVDPTVALEDSPYRTGHDGANLDFEAMAPDINAATQTPLFDPTDDPGEHLGLVRAIRNSVSIRSDVYVAYVTLVGFTPGDIRQADERGASTTDKLAALKASMEQRYMVVFDRSGVQSPSDRPRVLFAVQEVAKP